MADTNIPKAYDFKATEPRVYEMWEKNGYFKPWNDPNRPGFDPDVRPFVISIPPPNVTGELHLGHAMFVSMEDLMIRYHRMKGIPTLWVPGSDHAGIATQLMVERYLLQTEEVTREELGREEFVKRTWDWKKKYGNIISDQVRRLGASCDWDRERFTLDEGLSRAVREAFVRLYEKGLIYRGPRLINWSPGLKTAVSDLEVEYSEEEATLYYFKYMLVPETPSETSGVSEKASRAEASNGQTPEVDAAAPETPSDLRSPPPNAGNRVMPDKMIARRLGEAGGGAEDEYIPVATVRPETILGDTAVAVHPEDERYKRYIGRKAIVPILGREIPVIADEYVSREFGTGALKITPGHDPNDYAIAQRHNLPVISVLDEAAKVKENGGPYQGQDRFEAREHLWADMKKAGLVIKTQPYTTTIPRSQRGGEIIEPMISTQWFVKMESLAQAALAAVRDGRIKIVPERFEKVYYNWLENIKDWCISRQLWWGHRIPVWYCPNGHMTTGREDPKRCTVCGSAELTQDPDVLDTWFSSGLWPFSTLGWPDETPDYRYFYPNSYMETGYDILFFWVARMIMSGLEFTGKAPFHTVYLHGLIRDEHARKMSKTYGNVIDPRIVMDELGTDALRFTLLVGATPGNDMNISLKKVEANRNFANKVWNAGRFVITAVNSQLSAVSQTNAPKEPQEPTLADQWIGARLQTLVRDVERLFQTFQYGEAGRQIYEFFWSDFADWYVEIAKRQLQSEGTREQTARILTRVLDTSLRLLHPFMPFITEELWGHLRKALRDSPVADMANDWPEALIVARWPEAMEPEGWEEGKTDEFSLIQDIVRSIRNFRAEKNAGLAKRLAATLVSADRTDLLSGQSGVIAALAGLDPARLSIVENLPKKPEETAVLVVGPVEIYLPLSGMVDEDAERVRLSKELTDAQSQIARLEKLLGSDFANKAPAAVVAKEREKLAAYKETADKLRGQLN